MSTRRAAGMTLVELIIAIVIVGIALAGLAAAYARANLASADPIATQQMLAIAESMMEEILLKPFAVDATPAPSRAGWNDVRDANGYASNGIFDVSGNKVDGLEGYALGVAVDQPALTGIPAGGALRVRVTVTHRGQSLTLTGWRTQP